MGKGRWGWKGWESRALESLGRRLGYSSEASTGSGFSLYYYEGRKKESKEGRREGGKEANCKLLAKLVSSNLCICS